MISGEGSFDNEFKVVHSNVTNVQEDFRFPGGGDADRDIIADTDGNRLYKAFGCKFVAVYHYFDTVEDDAFDGTYGDEIDLVLVKQINKNIKLLVKYANFMQDDNGSNGVTNPAVDTEILTVRLQYEF